VTEVLRSLISCHEGGFLGENHVQRFGNGYYMYESSSSRDEDDIAEEENQDVEVIYEKPMWKALRQQC